MSVTEGPPSGLRSAGAVIRRRILIVVLVPIVTMAAAFGLSSLPTKQYTASSSLLFNDQSAAQQAAGITSTLSNDPTGQRATNLLLVQLADVSVSRKVASSLLGVTPKQIESAVTAAQAGVSSIVSISATWPDPKIAARIANVYAQKFISLQHAKDEATVEGAIELVQSQFNALTRLQKATPQGQSLLDRLETLNVVKALQNNISIVQSADVPTVASSPKPARNLILGAVIGIILGLALAFQADSMDQRLREPAEVERVLGLPLLGVVPHGAGRPPKKPAHGERWNVELEPFRMLRAHLRYFNVDRDLRVLLIVSHAPAEGKTTVAYGLAAGAASMGTKTLLIEADLRGPVITQVLGLDASLGLTGALIGPDGLDQAIRRVSIGEPANPSSEQRWLDVIPAGPVPPNPTELLESQSMELALDWARQNYELVIVDSAPLSAVPDSIPLVTRADGIVVVSRLGRSRRDAARRLREQLEGLDAPTIGVVVNDIRDRRNGYYGYGYGAAETEQQLPERSFRSAGDRASVAD